MVGAVPSGPVERLSTNDLTVLATDRGSVPMNIAAALVLDRARDLSLAELGTLLDLRLSAVPRLRQRLAVTPVGCGRPVWVDDASFSLQRHLSGRSVSTETELLEVVADLGSTRLDPQLPLWRAVLVQGLPGDRSALVLVLHHVLADGLGGLAVLAALTDGAPGTDRSSSQPSGAFPRPAPDLRDLALDSARAHVAGLRGLPAALARGLRGLQELGLGTPATSGGEAVAEPADRRAAQAVPGSGPPGRRRSGGAPRRRHGQRRRARRGGRRAQRHPCRAR